MKIDEEKSFNEMVSDIKSACEASHADGICKRQTTVCAFCAAGHLIEQGWRREEEIQRETAKKILEALLEIEHKSVCNAKSECEWWSEYDGWCNKLNKEQCAEYGLFRTWSKESINKVFQRFGAEV